jgi:hypothetical protein
MLMDQTSDLGRGLAAVVMAWLLLVGLLLGLQAAGRNFGFNVWWSGEARTWMMWLQDGPGSAAARIFWEIDGRNPLSPWWYIAVRDFIFAQPAAFFILHLATSLLLGVSSYLAVVAVTAGRGRLFGVSLGILAAVFLCSTRTDNIHWLFIGALACSLLSVAGFAQFLNSGRQRAPWLVWSLILWTVAYQTYTIQAGAVLAVGALSFTQEGRFRGARDVVLRMMRAAVDALPYVATLLLFVLVWKTTSGGITESTSFSNPARILQSLQQGVWHSDYTMYLAWARQIGPKTVLLVLVVGVPTLVVAQGFVGGASPQDDAPIRLFDLGRVVMVGLCIVAPTVLLESTSRMHAPGSRWVMVLQFWAPLLALSSIAAAVLVLPRRAGLWTWWTASAGLAAGGILLTLGMNQTQTYITRDERAFMAALEQIAIEDRAAEAEFPRHYLVKHAPGYWLPSDFVGRAYARTEFGEVGKTTFRYLMPGPVLYRPVFLPDRVENPEYGRKGMAPYSRVGVLAWDGKRMTRMSGADRATFDGLAVEWKRSEPLP